MGATEQTKRRLIFISKFSYHRVENQPKHVHTHKVPYLVNTESPGAKFYPEGTSNPIHSTYGGTVYVCVWKNTNIKKENLQSNVSTGKHSHRDTPGSPNGSKR